MSRIPFNRNYALNKGCHFVQTIFLESIYVILPEGTDPVTAEGGARLKTDVTKNFQIPVTVSSDRLTMSILMSSANTTAIPESGDYEYAIDITCDGIVKTVLEGSLLVKDDISKIIIP